MVTGICLDLVARLDATLLHDSSHCTDISSIPYFSHCEGLHDQAGFRTKLPSARAPGSPVPEGTPRRLVSNQTRFRYTTGPEAHRAVLQGDLATDRSPSGATSVAFAQGWQRIASAHDVSAYVGWPALMNAPLGVTGTSSPSWRVGLHDLPNQTGALPCQTVRR